MSHPHLAAVLGEAQRLGFLGPGSIDAQISHSEALAELLHPLPPRILDLGSGGGVPGLVWAARAPSSDVVLVDAQSRRCRFLQAALQDLGAIRGRVACGRAEELARDPLLRGAFDLVVARAFGAPAITAECAVGFLRPGGVLAVSEPPTEQPDRWPSEPLSELGFDPPRPRSAPGAHAIVMTLPSRCDDRWPRRTGVPAKRPLW